MSETARMLVDLSWRARWLVLLAPLGLLLACSDGGTTPEAASPTTTAATPVDPAGGWPTAGMDLRNTRTAVGSTINEDRVADLAPGWSTALPDLGGLSTVPIVADGTVYVEGASGQVVALDLRTGGTVWASPTTQFNIGPYGVAVDADRVYALDGYSGVQALDREDATQLWSTDLTPDTTGVGIQPVIAGDVLLVSSVPVSIGGIYTAGDRGVVYALDLVTGEVRWSFDTVLGDDLWGHPEVNSGGGAWYPPAVDIERGLVYVGVANPAPFPGTAEWPNGSSRPGDNLYTNSLVALDLETGQLAWYHQVIPHDLFDRDQVHALIATTEDGHDVVISAGKSGVVVGLDPDDGTVLWETEVGQHENDDLTALDGPTTMLPGTYGGVLTPPATADGVVYLPVVNAPAELRPDEVAYFGAEMGTSDGELVAVDASDGTILWSTDVTGDPLGGATVVNDLVFTALLDGRVLAARRSDGAIVWEHQAPGGINGWMAVAGDQLIVPVGTSPPATVATLTLGP